MLNLRAIQRPTSSRTRQNLDIQEPSSQFLRNPGKLAGLEELLRLNTTKKPRAFKTRHIIAPALCPTILSYIYICIEACASMACELITHGDRRERKVNVNNSPLIAIKTIPRIIPQDHISSNVTYTHAFYVFILITSQRRSIKPWKSEEQYPCNFFVSYPVE